MNRALFVALAIASAIVVAAPAPADDGIFGDAIAPPAAVHVGPFEEAYGTASLTAHVVGSFDFETRNNAQPLNSFTGVERYFIAPNSIAAATPFLPNGAQVERLELRACDSDPAAAVTATLGRCAVIGAVCAPAATVATTATPGCNTFSVDVSPAVIVDNASEVLILEVRTGTSTATTFSAVKLYYRLRVSPAPAVATFPNDVPTAHPFFRFIEALAAAGVTGGCGAGSFCPDAPVTRGQMAVFLATALGLHFPN